MTLPSSGALSLSDIQTEFGGSNPIAMSEYYAGGAYVQSGASGSDGSVPSSGAIGFGKFHGVSHLGAFTVAANNYAGSGSGTSSSFPWNGSSTASVGSGGPTSGDFTYLWTYVTGGVYSHSGENTATLNISHTGSCPAASTVTDSTTWNIHMVDNVSGQSSDKQVTFSYQYTNNSG